MTEQKDEVSYSDYRAACIGLEHCAVALQSEVSPDEAVLHWLPKLTQHVAVIFSFVGDNATLRHYGRYVETVEKLQAAKDRVDSRPPQTGGT